ncbi:PH domain-containing protein [Streptomyces sp. NPDC048208]|uniref:PH domain-containing protein n=1 Tax=unclassified Streptomyces TaxID=2593676 RepID=UPI0013715600|nr:PH domain-containing protein [Streptomyces sp. SID4982]MYS13523.1 PH domain-containing protein [Streptomyces sp. SID4982]
MTTPDHQSPASRPVAPAARDRIYRSPMALVGGVLVLALVVWLGCDALFRGTGRVPWLALAVMILVVPLVTAFTLRPAVFADEERLRVRNPFRVIHLPWGRLSSLRSGYSNEALTGSGTKFQLWAIPVSLRARKRAANKRARAAADAARGTRGGSRFGGVFGGGGAAAFGAAEAAAAPARAESDKIMDDLRDLHERHGEAEHAQGEISVRWAYEILIPALAGAVLLAVLLITG